jgi:hypothetical protein
MLKKKPATLQFHYTLNGIHLTDLEVEKVAFAIEVETAIPMEWTRKGTFITIWTGRRPMAEGEPGPSKDLELAARAAARRAILDLLPDLCRVDGWADTSTWPDG